MEKIPTRKEAKRKKWMKRLRTVSTAALAFGVFVVTVLLRSLRRK